MALHIYFTTDVHGNYFSQDFRYQRDGDGGLERVYGFMESQRALYGRENVILIDGGDMIQGGPEAYYLNHIQKVREHGIGLMTKFVGYDAGTVGNHDIESGRNTLKRFKRDCGYPLLSANITDKRRSHPFAPYTILERGGKRIALVGFTTPATKHWLPGDVCRAYDFRDIIVSALDWSGQIQAVEHPDLMIAVLHSGWEGGLHTRNWDEHVARQFAESVNGFDLVLYGHDHFSRNETVKSSKGRDVVCLNASCYGYEMAEAVVSFDGNGEHHIKGILHDIRSFRNEHSDRFRQHFSHYYKQISDYTSTVLGTLKTPLKISDAYMGPSAYMTLLHQLQLHVSGADISLCSPYFTDSEIPPGPFTVAELYTIYWFEDRLYTIRMKGKEIKNLLERSYDLWTRTRKRSYTPLLKATTDKKTGELQFENMFFHFDNAAGIDYEVDTHKKHGRKIRILQLSDGRPFNPEAEYTVATIANRALDGGGMMTLGAGISPKELRKRIVSYTRHDIRYYLREYIEEMGVVKVETMNNWKFLL